MATKPKIDLSTLSDEDLRDELTTRRKQQVGTKTLEADPEFNPAIVDDETFVTNYMKRAADARAKANSERSGDRQKEIAAIGEETRKTISRSHNRGYNTPAEFDSIAATRKSAADLATPDWFHTRHGNAWSTPELMPNERSRPGVTPAPGQTQDQADRAAFYRDLADFRLGRTPRPAADTATASGLNEAAARNAGSKYSANTTYGNIGVRYVSPQKPGLPSSEPIMASAPPAPAPQLLSADVGSIPATASLPPTEPRVSTTAFTPAGPDAPVPTSWVSNPDPVFPAGGFMSSIVPTAIQPAVRAGELARRNLLSSAIGKIGSFATAADQAVQGFTPPFITRTRKRFFGQ